MSRRESIRCVGDTGASEWPNGRWLRWVVGLALLPPVDRGVSPRVNHLYTHLGHPQVDRHCRPC